MVNVPIGSVTLWELTETVQTGDPDLVYTVPTGQLLVVTDAVITHNVNTTTNTFRVNIRRGPASNPTPCETAALVLGPYVSPDGTVSLSLTTGILFKAEEQICVVVGGAGANEGVSFTLTGFTAP